MDKTLDFISRSHIIISVKIWEYYVKVDTECPPEQRRGQWAYNLWASEEVWGEGSSLIRGGQVLKLDQRIRENNIDPFYSDDRLPQFYDFIEKHWPNDI